jgi:hypothetical protein
MRHIREAEFRAPRSLSLSLSLVCVCVCVRARVGVGCLMCVPRCHMCLSTAFEKEEEAAKPIRPALD